MEPAGSGLLGIGFPSIDTGTAGAVPLDGMIAICWACMGIVGGLVCLGSLLYAIGLAIAPAVRDGTQESVVLGALACGWLVQLPLACVASGELGFACFGPPQRWLLACRERGRRDDANAQPIRVRRSRPGTVRMVALLASGALLGKILGFARELLMARVFGASLIADSFRGAGTAVMMPLIPMQNEGVPAVMIPMHRTWQEQGRAPEYFAALCAGLTAIAALIALAIEASGGWWVASIMGRMEPEGQRIALTFVRVMALWMPASVLLNCLSAAEIATGRSRIAALRPAVLNTSVMTGIALYAFTGTLIFLPVLFALSFNLLGVWSVWTLWREGALDPKGLRMDLILGVLREFVKRLRPLMAQPLAEQGQVWLERIVASGFAVGTLASIDYARTLTDSAVLLISQPIGMAVLYKGISSNPRARRRCLSPVPCLR